MTRLLHLLGRAPDYQTEHTLRALQQNAGAEHDVTVRIVGPGGAYANPLQAVIGLRREAAAFDVVHAWDGSAMTAAALAGARRIIFSPPPAFRGRGIDWVRFAMRWRDVRIVCTTAAQQNRFVAGGIPAGRCRLVRPPVEVRRAPVARDAGLRLRLGIGEDDFVLLAPGESTRPAAHERAVWTGSILHVIDERYKVLLWGRGERAEAAAGLGRKLRQPGLVVVAEQALGRQVGFEKLLPAADAMLVTARGPVSPLPVALAMAAGVPIVCPATSAVAELAAGGGPVALTTPADSPRLLAQRVLDLRADAKLRERVIESARAAARERFDFGRFLDQYQELYGPAGARPWAALSTRRATAGSSLSKWQSSNLRKAQLNTEDR